MVLLEENVLLANLIDSIINGNEQQVEASLKSWEEEITLNRNIEHIKKTLYLTTHENPRIKRTAAVDAYINKGIQLKKKYLLDKSKASIREWLIHCHNIPDILTEKESNVYTMYKT